MIFIPTSTEFCPNPRSNWEDVKERINNLWDNQFEFLDEENFIYKNVHQHVMVRCRKCNYINPYGKRINDLLHGFGCDGCNGRIKMTNEELKSYVEDITVGDYSLLSDHSKTRDIATFRHNDPNCKNKEKDGKFDMKIHNFKSLDQRCPYCNKGGKGKFEESKGVKEIKRFFKENDINYKTEMAFNSCRSDLGNLLYFDFYLPDYNLLIEFDGRQHFEVFDYMGGQKVFDRLKRNDEIKNEFAKNSDQYSLLRISYKQFKDIRNILNETLLEKK